MPTVFRQREIPDPILSRHARLPDSSHEAHPWVIARIAPDFRLLDVWALPVEGDRDGFPAFLETLSSFDPAGTRFSAGHALFWLRRRLGALLGWDDPTKRRPIPGSSETTLSARLPDELRGSADIPLFGGATKSAGGGFRPLYRTGDEYAAEIANDTVHGVLHLAWVERPEGRYRAQLGVYVKPRGALGEIYLRLIQPFRHLIVYPWLTRRIGRAWEARSRPSGSSQGSREPCGMHAKDRLLREFREVRHAGGSIERFLADDVVWHVPGRSLIAGDYHGKTEVLSYFERRRALAGGTFVWEIQEILIGERHVVELTTGRARRGGRDHEWEALGLIRIERDLIAECWLVPRDLYRFDEAWS